MRKILEFIGANLLLLAMALMGMAAFCVIGVLINALAPEPDALPLAWAAAAALAFAVMGYGGRGLHRWISRRMRHSTARSKSGARLGSI